MLILIAILAIVLVSILPFWGYSREWGYTPSAILGAILIGLLIYFVANLRHGEIKIKDNKAKIELEQKR